MKIGSDLGSPPETSNALMEAVVKILRNRLPSIWQVSELEASRQDESSDGMVLLTAPDGCMVPLWLNVKFRVLARDVPFFERQLREKDGQAAGGVHLVVSRYLSDVARQQLIAAGLSYVDATGNIYLSLRSPALFISMSGAEKDPWRGPGRPRATLGGEPAAKVVRALLDFTGPWRIRQLVELSKSSTGSVYRVLDYLESENLILRLKGGIISVPDWPALLTQWSKDYQFLNANKITRWVAPRGLETVIEKVRTSEVGKYAVTGSIAAMQWEAYAPPRSAMIYCADPTRAASEWELRATDSAANVLLASAAYDVVFERSIARQDGLCLAGPAQVAVDLLTGPGRAPSEGVELMEWMKRNEGTWRRKP